MVPAHIWSMQMRAFIASRFRRGQRPGIAAQHGQENKERAGDMVAVDFRVVSIIMLDS